MQTPPHVKHDTLCFPLEANPGEGFPPRVTTNSSDHTENTHIRIPPHTRVWMASSPPPLLSCSQNHSHPAKQWPQGACTCTLVPHTTSEFCSTASETSVTTKECKPARLHTSTRSQSADPNTGDPTRRCAGMLQAHINQAPPPPCAPLQHRAQNLPSILTAHTTVPPPAATPGRHTTIQKASGTGRDRVKRTGFSGPHGTGG